MGENDKAKILKGLGDTFRKAREEANLTQADVASKVGMDLNYYARIERGVGNPSFLKMYSIMKALDLKSLSIE